MRGNLLIRGRFTCDRSIAWLLCTRGHVQIPKRHPNVKAKELLILLLSENFKCTFVSYSSWLKLKMSFSWKYSPSAEVEFSTFEI